MKRMFLDSNKFRKSIVFKSTHRIKRLLTSVVLIFVILTMPCYAQSTTTSFGTNVYPSLYYNPDGMFVDLMNHTDTWFIHTGTGTASPPLTANGYPSTVGSSQCFLYFDGYPNGDYQFYGEGDFNITFSITPTGIVSNLTKVGNITTATITLTDPPPGPLTGATPFQSAILLNLTVNDPNNPPNNFHLISPGYPAYPNNPTFSTPYIQALAPFNCLRMMDYMNTNANQTTSWASRPADGYFGFANQGESYEKMIELANAACKDLWINIPLYATDDWATGMAQLIKAKLNPKLHVYYEYSNECWNWFFPNWQVVENWAQANPSLNEGQDGAWYCHGEETALLLMHFTQIMQPILGSQGRPILAGQFSNIIYCTAGLAWIQKTYGAPSQYIYGIAGAPYFFGNEYETDVDTLFANTNNYLSTTNLQEVQANTALAKQYNVKYLCYEMGQGLEGSSAAVNAAFAAAQQDPRMAACYQTSCKQLMDAGADLCCFYNFVDPWTAAGWWGALTDLREAAAGTSVKYNVEAQIALSGAPGCNCSSATTTNNSSTHASSTKAQMQAWAAQLAAKNAAKAAAATRLPHNTQAAQSTTNNKSMTKAELQIWAAQLAAKNAAKVVNKKHP